MDPCEKCVCFECLKNYNLWTTNCLQATCGSCDGLGIIKHIKKCSVLDKFLKAQQRVKEA